MKLLIASKNLGKIREFRELLKPLGNLDLYSLMDMGEYASPEESGETFIENAELKAKSASQHFPGFVTLADDSGLVVPALGGAPGVHSARYAGADARDIDNRKKLLAEIRELPEETRGAYFECVISLAQDGEVLKTVTGRCEGHLTVQEKGSNGFGYDPLFIKSGYSKTFAELGNAVKNEVSHRRKALEKVALVLEKFSPSS